MTEISASFLSGWVIGIVILGLAFLAWLSVGIFTAKKGSISPPDQVWDEDLREGNDDPPKWWFYALFSTLIFTCAYVIAYPGFGNTPGLLSWTQHSQYEEGLAYYRARTGDIHKQWETASLGDLRADQSAMASAERLYQVHCASCHGDDARGQAGLFPNLADDVWHWGGSDEQILTSLNAGRVAAMPAWPQLGEDGILAVTDYVVALTEDSADATELERGRDIYAANCAVCHGANGEGNQALGSPSFAGGHVWQYRLPGQDVREAIANTLRNGRQGVMPAQAERLRQSQIRLLAAWLGGGMDLAPPDANI